MTHIRTHRHHVLRTATARAESRIDSIRFAPPASPTFAKCVVGWRTRRLRLSRTADGFPSPLTLSRSSSPGRRALLQSISIPIFHISTPYIYIYITSLFFLFSLPIDLFHVIPRAPKLNCPFLSGMSAASGGDQTKDSKYRAYAKAIDQALKTFETPNEWADLISALGKLAKVSETLQLLRNPRFFAGFPIQCQILRDSE